MLTIRLLSLLSARSFSSSSGAGVTRRMEIPAKALGLFPERFSSLQLLQAKTKVSIRLEGNTLLLEGEEAAVNQVMEKLSPIKQSTVQQKDLEMILRDILGEPVKMSAQDIKLTANLPRLPGEQTWMLRSRLTNSLLLWADTPENANKMIERIKLWSPVMEDFSAHKNWKKEVAVHPSFRWADRHAALADVDAIIEIFHGNARIWAVDDATADKAAQLLTSPYRRSAEGTLDPLVFKLSSEIDAETLDAIKSSANKLIVPGDESIALSGIDDATHEIKFNTWLQARQVIPAFERILDKVLGEKKLSTAYMHHVPKSAIGKGLEDIAKVYPSVKGFAIDVSSASSPSASTTFLTLFGPNPSQVYASRGLFAAAAYPDQVKLEMPALGKLRNDMSKQFLRLVEENVLGWSTSKNLRYWGDGIFSATGATEEERNQIKEQWSRLVSRSVDKPNAETRLGSAPYKVAYWHSSATSMLIVGLEKDVEEYIAKVIQASSAKEESSKQAPSQLESGDEEKKKPQQAKKEEKQKLQPAKVTRITVPPPPAAEAPQATESKIKVTRITAPPPHHESGQRPIKVTRITVPDEISGEISAAEIDAPQVDGDTKKASLKDKLMRTGARSIRSPSSRRSGGDGEVVDKTVTLPRKFSGLVLGKHGLVMKGIEQRTQTRIQLRNVNVGESKVVITGKPGQVELAAQEINEIVESAEEEQPMRRKSFRDAGSDRDSSQQQQYQQREAAPSSAKRAIFSPGYRQKVWDTYKSDPERWTTQALCEHFQLSPEHLKGIMVVMKHRDEYLERNKDDEKLVSKQLEDAVVKKVGEATYPLPELERPICKPHYRFIHPDEEVEQPRFTSVDEELAYNQKQYEEKKAKIVAAAAERPKPKKLLPPLQVTQSGKFQVVFQQ